MQFKWNYKPLIHTEEFTELGKMGGFARLFGIFESTNIVCVCAYLENSFSEIAMCETKNKSKMKHFEIEFFDYNEFVSKNSFEKFSTWSKTELEIISDIRLWIEYENDSDHPMIL